MENMSWPQVEGMRLIPIDQMLDIEYEFAFFSLSSSNRDEDLNSDLDKYESFLRKDDSALYLQNRVAYKDSMEKIDYIYGPFDPELVQFYTKALADDNGNIPINSYQKDLIFNLFYKFFGDPKTLNFIDCNGYVKLIIAAKRILEDAGMILLPHIISSKVVHLATRKNINKKDLMKLEASDTYQQVCQKYRSEKIQKHILGLIATTMTSDFQAIEPEFPEINGKKIQVIPDLILEEIPQYVNLI